MTSRPDSIATIDNVVLPFIDIRVARLGGPGSWFAKNSPTDYSPSRYRRQAPIMPKSPTASMSNLETTKVFHLEAAIATPKSATPSYFVKSFPTCIAFIMKRGLQTDSGPLEDKNTDNPLVQSGLDPIAEKSPIRVDELDRTERPCGCMDPQSVTSIG